MRLKLVMLSILRVLPMARRTYIVLLSVLFLAGSGICFAASHTRAHQKAVSAHGSHTQASEKKRAHKRVAAKASVRSAHTSAHRRTAHSRTLLARSGRARRSRRGRYVRASLIATRVRDIRTAEMQTMPPSVGAPPHRIGSRVEEAAINPTADLLPPPQPLPTREIALSSAPMNAIPLHSEIVAMAPLRGSMESLVRQNEKTDADNLERIQDDADLRDRIARHLLVPVPASDALTVNANLPPDRRYCRPWTASFLTDLSRAHQAEFHHPFEVSSAVRTVEYQKKLMRINGNAAAAEGDVASPHLTGATIDIAKSGLSRSEIFWMRNRLSALQDEGKIDVEEEFRQACFHITVYKSYIGAGPAHKPHHAEPSQQAAPAVADGDPTTGF